MNWRFAGLWAFALLLSLLTGCASVVHGTTQTVKIETLTPSGQVVDGAECKVTNDKTEAVMRSGQSVPVRRSGGNLSIECAQPGQPPASGQATSRVNGGMVGNLVLGGLIGVAIDSGTGAGFNYPSWMQLVFGEVRVFDRSSQNGEMALAGLKVGQTQVALASPSDSPSPAPTASPVGSSTASPVAASTASPVAASTAALAAAPSASPPASSPASPPVPIAAALPPPAAAALPVAAAPPPASVTRVSIDDLSGLLPAKP